MLTHDFLKTVITSPEGWFCLALGNGGNWMEEWYRWPDDIDKITARSATAKDHSNVYFSSYLFKAPQSTKENVLPTRTIQADLDNADIARLPKPATVLVETSPGRHQAFWVLDREVDLEQHEELSKKITYSIPECDRSGWALGRKVRIPNTKNYKYLDGPKDVHVVRDSIVSYEPDLFEALPEVPQYILDHYDPVFLETPEESDEHPLELLERIKDEVPVKVYISFTVQQADRSEALWALMCSSFKAGLSRAEVFSLAKASANNKFADLHSRADQELAKDVLRAEQTVRSGEEDPRTTIYNILKSSATTLDKKKQVYAVVLSHMKTQGEFLHTYGGLGYYIRRDMGKPIAVTAGSEQLQALLDIQFGLNYTESECRYVLHGLRSYITTIPETSVQSALAHYDPSLRHLLLHTGRRDVLRITPSSIDKIVDGAYNIVFPWGQSSEPFSPTNSRSVDWGEELFGNGTRGFGTTVDNINNMTPSQAKALLKTWFLFLLFRNSANTKPIIATFGQPGSGKTTMFKKVYTILYGRRRSINAVTNVDDFDHATANDPLVVLDNVDTWERWLPDRLAVSAGSSDVIKRKLYTDTDTITLRRQAVIGVTAHNPKFGREDVADRFLLFSFMRFEKFVSEEMILSDLYKKRNAIWGAIIHDVQKILATEPPKDGIPQFRIEDFARYGLWIARAINVEKDFRAAIEDVKSSQQAFSLEEEALLVSCILKFVAKNKKHDEPYTATALWSVLEACADDPRAFSGVYRNAVVLSKKLSAMQASLSKIVDIQQSTNDTGNRVWTIKPKTNGDDNANDGD